MSVGASEPAPPPGVIPAPHLDLDQWAGDSIMVSGSSSTSKTSGVASAYVWTDPLAATTMSRRLMEAGEEVPPEEIILATRDLQKAMREAGVGGGSARLGRSGRFRIWRDLSGAGVLDADTASGGIRVSMTIQAVENNVIVQTTIPDGDGHWELHDTPGGGAARTQIKIGEGGDGAYVYRETHYSYGRRWDPTPDQAAENFFHENGKIRCRQRFVQGAARGTDEHPVFEAFRADGTPLITEYGNASHGKHRGISAGYAYQEFHPCGALALALFSNFGTQRGATLFFSPDGKPIADQGTSQPVPCATLTNADAWVARAMAAEREAISGKTSPKPLKPLGAALSEALSQMQKGSSRRSRTSKTR